SPPPSLSKMKKGLFAIGVALRIETFVTRRFRSSSKRSDRPGSRLLQRYIRNCQNGHRPRLFILEALRQLDRTLQLHFCKRPQNDAKAHVFYSHASNFGAFPSPELSTDPGIFTVECLR